MKHQIQHINPDGMHKNAAFTQAVVTIGPGKTIYIGGQNAVNGRGEIVGRGDISVQTVQTMQNVQAVLEASGAGWEQVVKLSIHIVQGHDLLLAFQAAQQFLGKIPRPPAVTVQIVSGLANPGYLLEVDAIAFVADQ